MHKIVQRLLTISLATATSILALSPSTARAETDQDPYWGYPGSPSEHRLLRQQAQEKAQAQTAAPLATPQETPTPATSSIKSDCEGFDFRECMTEAECSWIVVWCKEMNRKCRDWTPSPPTVAPNAASTKPSTVTTTNHATHENRPVCDGCDVMACLLEADRSFKDSLDQCNCTKNPKCCEQEERSLAIAFDLCEEQNRKCCALKATPTARSPDTNVATPPATEPFHPDCTRLVNENHPDCQP